MDTDQSWRPGDDMRTEAGRKSGDSSYALVEPVEISNLREMCAHALNVGGEASIRIHNASELVIDWARANGASVREFRRTKRTPAFATYDLKIGGVEVTLFEEGR